MQMRRRTRGQRGAAMVEFAIVLPLLLLLVFGMIDFASIYNDYQAVRQGAGAGDRIAVVNQSPVVTSPNCNSTNVSNIHMSNVPRAGSEAANLICYTKARVGLDMDKTRVALVFNAPLAAGQPLMVCVQYPISSLTGYIANLLGHKAINTRAETIVEVLSPATPDASMSQGTVMEDPITSWPTSCSASHL